jgi:hypothetical protein
MASSLTPTTFNITVTEERIVRNSIIKHEVIHSIANITNVDHRILTCPADIATDIIKTTPPSPGAGTFVSSSIEYIRVTNLDTQYSAALILSGSNGDFTLEIKPKSTMLLSSINSSFDFPTNTGILDDTIKLIQVHPISSSIDIEYTVVNS